MDWGLILLISVAQWPLIVFGLLFFTVRKKWAFAGRYTRAWWLAIPPNLLFGSVYYREYQTLECGYACGFYIQGLFWLLSLSGVVIGLILTVLIYLRRRWEQRDA